MVSVFTICTKGKKSKQKEKKYKQTNKTKRHEQIIDAHTCYCYSGTHFYCYYLYHTANFYILLYSLLFSDNLHSYIMIFNYSITTIVILATLIVVTETVPIHPFMKSFVLPKENIVRRYTTGQEHHHHSIANILGWHRNENVKVTLLQTILLTIIEERTKNNGFTKETIFIEAPSIITTFGKRKIRLSFNGAMKALSTMLQDHASKIKSPISAEVRYNHQKLKDFGK
jgi:hypothetical protein